MIVYGSLDHLHLFRVIDNEPQKWLVRLSFNHIPCARNRYKENESLAKLFVYSSAG